MVAQVIQSQDAAGTAAGLLSDNGIPGVDIPVVLGPQDAPHVRGHGCRPAQLETGLLLLAHRLVHVQAPSRERRKGQDGRHERPQGQPDRPLSAQVLPATGAAHMGHPSHRHSLVLLERGPDHRLYGVRRVPHNVRQQQYIPGQ